MHISRLFFIIAITSCFFCMQNAFPCTEFRLRATDNTVLISRTMEFAIEIHSHLKTSNRNREFQTIAPNTKHGLSWKAKYGYVFFDAYNVDKVVDGINEKGLSFSALYLPGFTNYQSVPKGQEKKALPYLSFGDWVLGNFSSIEEVKSALKNIYVYQFHLKQFGKFIFPLHFSVYDILGNGLIIEFVDGKMKLYDNQIGVMTNSPTYDWHLLNLNNYTGLQAVNPKPVTLNGVQFAPHGSGFGMIGLPGDASPPSRFVKVATLLRSVNLSSIHDSLSAVNLAAHILDSVNIPLGMVQDPLSHDPFTGKISQDYTQWSVFKDLTRKKLYFRTYENSQMRSISLNEIDFSENAHCLKISLEGKQVIEDITAHFIHSPMSQDHLDE